MKKKTNKWTKKDVEEMLKGVDWNRADLEDGYYYSEIEIDDSHRILIRVCDPYKEYVAFVECTDPWDIDCFHASDDIKSAPQFFDWLCERLSNYFNYVNEITEEYIRENEIPENHREVKNE